MGFMSGSAVDLQGFKNSATYTAAQNVDFCAAKLLTTCARVTIIESKLGVLIRSAEKYPLNLVKLILAKGSKNLSGIFEFSLA